MAVPRRDEPRGDAAGQVSGHPLQRRGRASARALRGPTGRGAFFAIVLVLLLLRAFADPPPASGSGEILPDAIPTDWHEAAGLTPLLTAPPPENPATICIIDTGVTPTPDLNITARWAYDGGTLDDVRATDDSPGHGTLVAHFAAAAVNGWGGAGAFPHARIASVRVFPRDGGASWQDYIRAITRCPKLDPNTKVIVISIGGQEIAPGAAEELKHHIARARQKHDLNVVVAAGNGGGDVNFPARFEASLAVGGASVAGRLCLFSARGPELDLSAPGCGLRQTGWDGTSWTVDGTSFAAPIAAGALAALRTYAPGLRAPEAEALLLASASPPPDRQMNLGAALDAIGLAFSAPPPPRPDRPRPAPADVSTPTLGVSSSAPRNAWRLPRPKTRLRRLGRFVEIFAINRPAGVDLEFRVNRRVVRRRSSRVRLLRRTRQVRLRYVDEWRRSRATSVHW